MAVASKTKEQLRKKWDEAVREVSEGKNIQLACNQYGLPAGSFHYQRAKRKGRAKKSTKVVQPVESSIAKEERVKADSLVARDARLIQNLRKEISVYRLALGFED